VKLPGLLVTPAHKRAYRALFVAAGHSILNAPRSSPTLKPVAASAG
jgi:hypothetical protein